MPEKQRGESQAFIPDQEAGPPVASTKQKPGAGPFCSTTDRRQQARGKMQRAPLDRPLCVSGAMRTAGASNQWRVGACWCVYVACSKLFGQCHRRGLQLVCLSGLSGLSRFRLCLVALSAGLAGQRCARPDGMLLCRSRRPLPSCRRRANKICTAATPATLTRNLRAERATGRA